LRAACEESASNGQRATIHATSRSSGEQGLTEVVDLLFWLRINRSAEADIVPLWAAGWVLLEKLHYLVRKSNPTLQKKAVTTFEAATGSFLSHMLS